MFQPDGHNSSRCETNNIEPAQGINSWTENTHTHNLTKNFTQQKMVSGHQFNLVFAVREIQFDRFVIVKIVNRDV